MSVLLPQLIPAASAAPACPQPLSQLIILTPSPCRDSSAPNITISVEQEFFCVVKDPRPSVMGVYSQSDDSKEGTLDLPQWEIFTVCLNLNGPRSKRLGVE